MTSDPAAKDGRGHTPAPWRVSGTGFVVAYDEVIGNDISLANARRIVACVNACEGIADPEAFIGASRGDIADRMTADRDSLRERVKELTDMLMAIQELPDQAQASAAKHLADIALSKSPK